MSRNKINYRTQSDIIEIKSKFEAEFRRWGINKIDIDNINFDNFSQLITDLHQLKEMDFYILYVDPTDNDLLPINNDDNFNRALKTAKPLLRVIIQRKSSDDSGQYYPGYYGSLKPKTKILGILSGGGGIQTPMKPKGPQISTPHDFHLVSSIIDVDTVPETCRRVRLLKHGSDKPLGFYIRDGTSVRVTASGLEKQPGIFISRLVPGGLAESTGLLAVNDEILEVNGIEVNGKSLDQVTDMMVANSSNLIITVKPANQRNVMPPPSSRRESFLLNDDQQQSDDEIEQDEVIDLMSGARLGSFDEKSSNKDSVLHL